MKRVEYIIFASELRGGKSFLQILLDDPPKDDRYKKLKLTRTTKSCRGIFCISFQHIKDLKC